jgi:hypothetical protein
MTEAICSTEERRFFYLRMESVEALSMKLAKPYVVLIWNAANLSTPERVGIVQQLLRTGCRYVVTGGADCQAWHDLADNVFWDEFQTDEERELNFTMTTAHEGEALDDVVFFFIWNTSSEGYDFKNYLALQIGGDEALGEQLKQSIKNAQPRGPDTVLL